MIRSLYTAATGMDAQTLKMDVISNNLANTSTAGFKKVRAEFEDLLSETIRGAQAPDPRGGTAPTPLQVGLGVRSGTTSRAFAQGELIATQGPLDLAIEGEGFFRIQRQDGTYAYTRAGNFRVDSTGRVVNAHGELLDPEIIVPAETVSLTINADGTFVARVAGRDTPETLGQIDLVCFPNPGGLEASARTCSSRRPAAAPRSRRGRGSRARAPSPRGTSRART